MKLTYLDSDEFYPMYKTQPEPSRYVEYAVELPEDLEERLNRVNAEFEAVQKELKDFLDSIPNPVYYPFSKEGK